MLLNSTFHSYIFVIDKAIWKKSEQFHFLLAKYDLMIFYLVHHLSVVSVVQMGSLSDFELLIRIIIIV